MVPIVFIVKEGPMPDDRVSESQLDRIERKLDVLIKALAEDEEEPGQTLDGQPAGSERDQSQSLG